MVTSPPQPPPATSPPQPPPLLPKQKRRIAPIALALSPAPAAAAAPPEAARVPLETLDRYIQNALKTLRDDVDGMLANSFVPDASAIDGLAEGVRRVRGCVDRYNTAADAIERQAAAERERLTAELKPVKIDRTDATKAIYRKHKAALGGSMRFLYRCPLSDACTGVCTQGNASRASNPAAWKRIEKHVSRWHIDRHDPLRTWRRRSDDWWAEGGTARRDTHARHSAARA